MKQILPRFPLLERLRQEPIGGVLVSLAGDSAAYLAGGVLLGLGNVVLIPLYTRTLTTREFGVYALLDVTILLLVAVTALKLDVSYLKWFADLEPAHQGELLGTTLLTGLAASTFGGTILSLLVASHVGESWVHASVKSYAWLLLPIVVLENLQSLLLTDLRARRCAISYSGAAVVRLACMIFASYYLLAVRHSGLAGLFLGRLAGDAGGVLYLCAASLRFVAWRFAPSLLRPMLAFGLPLIWSTFTVMLQDASGRYFLGRSGTMEEVGVLGAAIKVGAVFQILVAAPFGVAWGSLLFQIAKQPGARIIYTKILNYVYVFALGVALVLAILAPALIHIFTAPAYYAAIGILPLILLVRAMNVIEQPAATGIYLAGRTKLFAGIYTVALALNLLMLHELVPRYGAAGVGWAWFMSSASVPILMLAIGQRFYRLRLSAKLVVVPIIAWIVVARWLSFRLWSLSATRIWLPILAAVVVVCGAAGLLASDFHWMRRDLNARGMNE
ncbi:MAG: oligosaccharide flippase family protein [Candidatus Acidiferrum sp.]